MVIYSSRFHRMFFNNLLFLLDLKHLVELVQNGHFLDVLKQNSWILQTCNQSGVKEAITTFLQNSGSSETR